MARDPSHPRIKHHSAMATDVGMVRDHNEDAAYVDSEGDFFIVADGMGGHAAGEVASAMAVDAVHSALEEARADIASFAREPSEDGRRHLVALLENAVRAAHQSVYERGTSEADKQGMGTTLDVVLVAGAEAFVAHVGDSRTYLVRDGKAAQITTDHTVAEVLVIEGKLSVEEAQISPLRTILVNAIGVAADVGVEMSHVRLREGDLLLLCSDGLHDYFPSEQEIASYVTQGPPTDSLEKLVTTAKNRGGHDNITGIVVEVTEVPSEMQGADDGDAVDEYSATADTGTMQALSDGVPGGEVGRDDTLPVDARTGMPVKGKLSSSKTTSAADADDDDADDDDAGADDGDADDADDNAQATEGDLRETMPIKPLASPRKPKPGSDTAAAGRAATVDPESDSDDD